MGYNKIIIFDYNSTILDILSMYVELSCEHEIIIAKSGNEAIETLNSLNFEVDLIISDYNMPNGTGGDLYNFIKKLPDYIPFVLQTAEPYDLLAEFTEFPRSKNDSYIAKPFTDKEIALSIENALEKPEEIIKEKSYSRIHIDHFYKYIVSSTDLYLMINKDKFVKFHNKEDKLDLSIVKKYKAKGIKYIYVDTLSYCKLIEKSQKNISAILSNPKIDPKTLVDVQFDSYTSIKDSLKSLGVSQSVLDLAQQSSNASLNVLKKSNVKIKSLLKMLLEGEQCYISRLSLLTSYMSIAIGANTTWAGSKTSEKLSMAAIMMDLSFFTKTQDCDGKYASISNLKSPEAKELKKDTLNFIEDHPKISASIYDDVSIDPDVRNIILCHHERPAKEGYPRGIGHLDINPIACIFIIAHEFSNQIINSEITLESLTELKMEFNEKFNRGNFKEAYKGFVKIFD